MSEWSAVKTVCGLLDFPPDHGAGARVVVAWQPVREDGRAFQTVGRQNTYHRRAVDTL